MADFLIAEEDGLQRAVILRGTSMPFKPLELGVEQRLTTTYYAANPVAFQRVLGPTFTPTTITGRWDDKRMRSTDRPRLFGFGELLALFNTTAAPSQIQATAGDAGGVEATTTAEIVAVMESIAKGGAKLRVEWDRYVRYGRIKRFTPRHLTVYQVEWEIEFEWSGDRADQPTPETPLPNVASFIDTMQTILRKILDASNRLEGLPTLRFIETTLGDIQAIAQEVIDDLGQVIDTTLAPAEALASVRASYERLRVECQALLDQWLTNSPGYGEAEERKAADGSIAAAVAREVARFVEILMEESMLRQAEINATLERNTIATFVAPDYMSLKQVAIQFFGTPDNWVQIQAHNNLFGSVLTPGQTILIPRLA